MPVGGFRSSDAVAGMQVRSQAVAGRDLGEQCGESLPLLRGEDVNDLVLVCGPDLAHPAHHGLTGIGELEFVVAAIARASLPDDEPLLLEFVDEHHDAAGSDIEAASKSLLAQARFDGDEAQDPNIARLKGKGRQPVREAPRRVPTDLGEKEADALRGISVLGVLVVFRHKKTLSQEERFCDMNHSCH